MPEHLPSIPVEYLLDMLVEYPLSIPVEYPLNMPENHTVPELPWKAEPHIIELRRRNHDLV